MTIGLHAYNFMDTLIYITICKVTVRHFGLFFFEINEKLFRSAPTGGKNKRGRIFLPQYTGYVSGREVGMKVPDAIAPSRSETRVTLLVYRTVLNQVASFDVLFC